MKDTILSKDTIHVEIGEDHSFNCTAVSIGRVGENDITQLEITIPEELNTFWAYIDFKKPKGARYKTYKLDIVNNIIEYDVPLELLNENGNLEVQVIFQNEQGLIWKSAIKKFVVLGSIEAVEDIVITEDFFTKAQQIVDSVDINTLLKTLEEEARKSISEISSSLLNKISSVTLLANQWIGETSPYSQTVTIAGATENSKIDLNPTIEQLNIFHNKDIAFVVENDNGVITAYCIGQKPKNDYTIQATITEVYVNG